MSAPTDTPLADPLDPASVEAAPAEGTSAEDASAEGAPDAAPAEEARKPGAMRFRRKFTTVRLTPDQASRQGQVATSAFRRFGERDKAMAFLNGHDEALGGRPLDLAIASAEGLATVEAAMAARTA